MELKGGDETDHGLGNRRSYQGETVVLRDRSIGKPVTTAGHAFQRSVANEPAEGVCVNTGACNLSPCDRAAAPRKLQHPLLCVMGRHVAKCRQLSVNVNVSPLTHVSPTP